MTVYTKDPQGQITYAIDWAAQYLGVHLIASSTWAVQPDEPGGIVAETSSHDTRRTSVTLSGGIGGKTYAVTNTITLTSGEVDQRSLSLRVEQR